MRTGTFSGSFPIFRVFGIQVYLHWLWFFAAAILVETLINEFRLSGPEALLVVFSLFGIVLIHEFGHALACRSVGGEARTIVLWPLGGVAFVKPPPRPGAVLWSIVAGPLVNVVLVPVTIGAWIVLDILTVHLESGPLVSAFTLIQMITVMNLMLLAFNMLPIYPLDGGQILQALLWFVVGRAKSLHIAASIGLVTAIIGGPLAFLGGRYWMVLMAVFIGWQAWHGFKAARILAAIERYERDRAYPAPFEVDARYLPRPSLPQEGARGEG